MRYQFTMDRPTAGSRGRGLAFVALISLGVAGYAFAACGDRNPDGARAGEPVITTPTPLPAPAPERPAPAPTPTTPSDFFTIGRAAWKAGDFARAESAFVQALALDSTHVRSRLYLSRVLIESGGGRAGDALRHIEAVIASDSTSSEPLRLQGRAYEVLGRSDEAIEAYRRAIVRNADDVWSLNNLGSLYIKLGRSEEALGPIARAIELEENVAIFHNNLGSALEKTGHYAAAAQAYRAALAVEGTYGPAATNLSRVEQLKEDPATQPVDLVALAQQFVDGIATWKQ